MISPIRVQVRAHERKAGLYNLPHPCEAEETKKKTAFNIKGGEEQWSIIFLILG